MKKVKLDKKKLTTLIKNLNKPSNGEVGIFDDQVVEYAIVQEFGSTVKNIPAKSYFRYTVDNFVTPDSAVRETKKCINKQQDLREPTNTTAKKLAEDLRQNAPKDTGRLANSIVVN